MKLLLPLLLAALVPSINANSNNTRIEQQLETEIDLREPRTFMSKNTEFLVVRNIGFNTINRYTASGQYIRTEAVNNWERFALK